MDQVPVFMTFGERLTWWIERRGITQAELGRAAGIKPSTVNELCKGESSQPRAAALLRMAQKLNLRPEYLMFGEGTPQATDFSQLSGLEAQLVMLYRGLPDDSKRDAMLIDLNHAYNKGGKTPSKAMPYPKPPPALPAPATKDSKTRAKA